MSKWGMWRLGAIAAAVVLVATGPGTMQSAAAVEASAATLQAPTVPEPDYGKPVKGGPAPARARQGEAASSRSVPAPTAVLPQAQTVAVSLPDATMPGPHTTGVKGTVPAQVTGAWQNVGTSGLQVAAAAPARVAVDAQKPAAADSAKISRVRVSVLSATAAAKLGLHGMVVSLSRADGNAQSAPVAVRVPGAVMKGRFGANYASRIRWVKVPAGGAQKASVVTPVAQATVSGGTVVTPAVSATPTLLVAASTPTASNGTGSYAATPLKSSAQWDVSEQTGAFSWSYDMPVVSPSVGPSPDLGLSYDSQLVDGETGSTNNQPSAVGEGWNLSASGFIERSYVPCATDDGASGPVATSGDLCWNTDNATVSIAGHSGTLVKDAKTGVWRLQNDDGTRFEHLVGAAAGCGASNGTYDDDCWRMTTTDGTQYYFGVNELPGWVSGDPVTNSAWSTPVYGNDPGEPCHASTFAASRCQQAWRWNLDEVVDTSGNAETFTYAAETNKYAADGSGAVSYTRGGALTSIAYGLRSSNLFGATAAGYKVLFTYDPHGRCSDSTGATCTTESLTGATMPAHPASYPDVPWDQYCTAASCAATQASPTFFTDAVLTGVDAQVLVAGAYQTVDSWALSHSYPAPGDGTSAALWLTKVQHTGTHAGQAAVAEPATVFTGTTLQNRVWVEDGLAPLDKWRLSSIQDTLGAVTSVNYQAAQCTASGAAAILAAPQSNTNWCFPQWWLPPTTPQVAPQLDLFQKYPVASVVVNGVTGGGLSHVQETQYSYGTPRWRYNDSPLTAVNHRTWNVFAGVDTVQIREGDPTTPTLEKVTLDTYYQGMNGDRASASGGTRTATVLGTTIPDQEWFAGQLYDEKTLLGVGGSVVLDQVDTPWASGVTANDGTLTARIVHTADTLVTEPASTGGSRTLDTATTFDPTYGYPLTVSTTPSDAAGKCVITGYAAPNTSAWVIGLADETRTVDLPCANLSQAQYPRDLVGDVRTSYDGAAWGAAAARGLPTRVQAVDGYSGTTPHWATTSTTSYDALGRSLVVADALGHTTTTAYTPAASFPEISEASTNTAPYSWTTTTTYDPTTGTPSQIVDPNGAATTVTTDALGRTSQVWLPLQPQAANPSSPSMSYQYTMSQTAPDVIQTTTLTAGGNTTSYQLFDGLGRLVQTQSPATGGGTVVSTTGYDAQGNAYWTDNPYWTTSVNPSTSLFVPTSESAVPSQIVDTYDAIGRVTKAVTNGLGQAKFQTTTSYPGADRVDIVPPSGGTPSSTFTNTLGQKTKLVQYPGGTITGTGQATGYGYDGAGHLTSMTDPGGNVWSWTYDLRGDRVAQTDPDSGTSTATYDAVGNMLTATDARGQTLATTYDALDRKTATYSGSTSGALLASWTYDTVKKGLVTASTSYVGSVPGTPGAAYTTTVGGYDAAGNVTSQTVSIPATAPAFAGTSYTTTAGYYPDSQVSVQTDPAEGGLPREQILYDYDALGRPSGLFGSSSILNSTLYTPIGQLSEFNRSSNSNNGYSTYGYDSVTGQTTQIQDDAVFAGAGHYVADRTYTHDDVGDVTSATMTSVLPSQTTQTYCYTYDGLQELTRVWSPGTSSTCASTPTAAALGGPAPVWNDYTYNTATGNRTSVTSHNTDGTTATAAYQYPAAGAAHPHQVTSITGTAGLGAGGYGTDASGNTTALPGQTLTYDAFGRVSTVTTSAGVQTNVYDASGKLLLRVDPTAGASLFLGDTVLTRPHGSATISGTRTYTGAQGIPVAERTATAGVSGSVMVWLFTDVDGNVDTQTIAATGATSHQYRDPFGVPLGGSTGVWADGNGFLNKPATTGTGLTTIGARTYAATIGMFLTVDPITDPNDPQQHIGYAYADDNPVTDTDPTGLLRLIPQGFPGAGHAIIVPTRASHTPRRVAPSRAYDGCTRTDFACRARHAVTPWTPLPDDFSPAGYTYHDHWALRSHATPARAMAVFKAHPAKIFPFEVTGCSTLHQGAECYLDTFRPRNGGRVPVPIDPVGHVGVTTSSTSVTFTVLDWGYFDSPGSTITFTASDDRNGNLTLNQYAHSLASQSAVTIAILLIHAEQPGWQQQARNLDRELDDEQ